VKIVLLTLLNFCLALFHWRRALDGAIRRQMEDDEEFRRSVQAAARKQMIPSAQRLIERN
jgi:hypothetical protein